jgi:hypothetical protein
MRYNLRLLSNKIIKERLAREGENFLVSLHLLRYRLQRRKLTHSKIKKEETMHPEPFAPERCGICQSKLTPADVFYHDTLMAIRNNALDMKDYDVSMDIENYLKDETPIQRLDQKAYQRNFCSIECLLKHLEDREEELEKQVKQDKNMRKYYRKQIDELERHPFRNFRNYFKGKVWISKQFKETIIKSFIWLSSVYLMAHLVIFIINR